jgi:hypothetical protein
VDPALEIE